MYKIIAKISSNELKIKHSNKICAFDLVYCKTYYITYNETLYEYILPIGNFPLPGMSTHYVLWNRESLCKHNILNNTNRNLQRNVLSGC